MGRKSRERRGPLVNKIMTEQINNNTKVIAVTVEDVEVNENPPVENLSNVSLTSKDKEVMDELENVNNEIIALEEDELSDFMDNTVIICKEEAQETNKLDNPEMTNNEKNTTLLNALNDPSSIYIKTMLDLFENVNAKVNELVTTKSLEYNLLEECYKMSLLKDYDKIGSLLKRHVKPVENGELVKHFVTNKVPLELEEIQKEHVNLHKQIHQNKTTTDQLIKLVDKLIEENRELSKQVEETEIKCNDTCNNLIKDSNKLKDGIIRLIKSECKSDINLNIDTDIIDKLSSIFIDKNKENDTLQSNIKDLKNVIEINEQKYKQNNIIDLKNEINDLNKRIKQLQNDNLEITENNNKLTQGNVKYQKDLVVFNTEIKKLIASDKIKTETILRQKKLIEMFQDKLIGGRDTVSQLKKKRESLDEELRREKDTQRKEKLEKQKYDCEKRLSDLLKRL